jgi:DNA-binding transcriptional LysR family regulator
MVVSIEELACFDLIIWLRTGENAASRLSISQPKVSRCVHSVSDILGIILEKNCGEWVISGDQKLLNLERLVHQEYRWDNGIPLRIESQYYSGPLYLNPRPNGWITGNFDYLEIHTPLDNLRKGVIDAWIGCYPDVPEQDDFDLCCFHLTRLQTYLVVSTNHPLVKLGDSVTIEDVCRYPSWALTDNAFPKIQSVLQQLKLWNLPQQAKRYSSKNWESKVHSDLVVGYATILSLAFFKNPQVILPVSIPLVVGDTLVVKGKYSSHPRFADLLQYLQGRARDLARINPEIQLSMR